MKRITKREQRQIEQRQINLCKNLVKNGLTMIQIMYLTDFRMDDQIKERG